MMLTSAPRVLVLEPGPNFSVADVQAGWSRALTDVGCHVVTFNLSSRLKVYSEAGRMGDDGEFMKMFSVDQACALAIKGIESACYEFWPDVILVVSGFYIPADLLTLLRARGHRIVLLHTESPYEDDRQIERCPYADINLLNDPTNLDRFRAVNPATYYMPHAYDPTIHYPRPAKKDLKSDFCFVGTGYQSRIDFLEQVDWGDLDVVLAGNWCELDDDSPLLRFVAHDLEECLDNTDAVDLYAATSTSANLYRVEAERPELSAGWAMGPREVELAACGTFCARQPRGEGDVVLPMLPTFTSPGELGEVIRWWARHPKQRAKVTAQAQAAIADRTFEANARQLLNLLAA